MDDSLIERREYKYVITEAQAAAVRRYIQPYCVVDPFAAKYGGEYTIESLYVDSPGLKLYKANDVEDPNRFKLRIRHYPRTVGGPHFLEVKRRIRDVVSKSRALIEGDWRAVLEHPSNLSPITFRDKDEANVRRFLSYYTMLHCRPVVAVRYDREPYFSPTDDYARVTFDRRVRYREVNDLRNSSVAAWRRVDDPVAMRTTKLESMVVLELKFVAQVVPHWLIGLVSRLNLDRQSFSKYGRSVESLKWVPSSFRIPHLRESA